MHTIETAYSPVVGKGGCYHHTAQGDNYTRYYQPLKMTRLGIRNTSWYYTFRIKDPFPGHSQVTKDSRASALLSISQGAKYPWADFRMFPICPYTASHTHTTSDGMPIIHACKHISAGTSRLHAATFSVHWWVYKKFNTIKTYPSD